MWAEGEKAPSQACFTSDGRLDREVVEAKVRDEDMLSRGEQGEVARESQRSALWSWLVVRVKSKATSDLITPTSQRHVSLSL